MRTTQAVVFALGMAACALLLHGCRQPSAQTGTTAYVRQTEVAAGRAARPEAGTRNLDRERRYWLERQIDLYLFANSDSYQQRCYGPPVPDWVDDPVYHREVAAMGLVAEASVLELGAAAIPALLDRFEELAPGGDGRDERLALRTLLDRMGPPGWKAYLRWLRRDDVPASDEDAEWIAFLRGKGKGWSDELLWALTRDANALATLEDSVDWEVRLRREWRQEGGADFTPEEDAMREVLAVAPSEGGMTDQKLEEWSRQTQSVGIRWAAYVALARRGDEEAQKSVRETLEDQFPLYPDELRWWVCWGMAEYRFPDEAAFLFVREVTDSRLPDRWELLLDLLSDPNPELLAPRAGVLVALQEHWQDLDAATQAVARRRIVELHWEEKNEWLRALMVRFLAARPAPEEELVPGPGLTR